MTNFILTVFPVGHKPVVKQFPTIKKALQAASKFAKFEDDVYVVSDPDGSIVIGGIIDDVADAIRGLEE